MSAPLRRIVIVGASLAGLRAAETLRREGFDGELTLMGAEPHMPYDRPPLSKGILAGETDAAEVALPVSEGLGAQWLLGEPAARLDLDRRVVTGESGLELPFDGLLIATGSEPRRLRPLDPGRPGILELRTLADALALRDALAAAAHVTIVGCGFIGVEVASVALAAGRAVTIVSLDAPLALAGEVVSDVCTRMLTEAGARLLIGRRVSSLEGPEALESVTLDDGTAVATDLALVAVGARPATDWLADSGLALDDGVLCDECCAALGAEGVVAAGDVARWPNRRFGGRSMRIEHWTNAVEAGAAAARTLLRGSGEETVYAPVPSFWSDHLGTRLQSVGLPGAGERSSVVDGSLAERRFVLASYRDDELVGAATYGMVRALAPYRIRLAGSHLRETGAPA